MDVLGTSPFTGILAFSGFDAKQTQESNEAGGARS